MSHAKGDGVQGDGAASSATPAAMRHTHATGLPPWIVGHRGARAMAPENSLEGFGWAIAHGLRGVELDVRLTRDDVLVCVHDETLLGYGGPADLIGQQAADVVTQVVLASGVRVPRLAAVLDLVEGRLAVNVELKNHRDEASFDDKRRSAAVLAELLARRAGAGHDDAILAVSSFDPGSVSTFAGCASPFSGTAALLTPPGRDAGGILRDATAVGVSAVHPHHTSLLIPNAVRRLRREGLTVRTWTVNSPRLAQRLLRAGVEAIVTDDPLRLANLQA